MTLTEEQISKAIDRREAFFFTDKEIEKLWHKASLKKNIELMTLNMTQHTLILDAMYLKAVKIDVNKANKILEITDYLKTSIHIQRINNLQADLIDESNLKMFEKDFRIRELEEELINLKRNIK
tara:strand:- start:4540 stop:4911 length:372 start_codon:yes stop_codon:yes gene_type:complete